MKDYSDLVNIIKEANQSFDDTHPHFQGVYDAFRKINDRTVPEATQMPTGEINLARRQRAISANKQRQKLRLNDDLNDNGLAKPQDD